MVFGWAVVLWWRVPAVLLCWGSCARIRPHAGGPLLRPGSVLAQLWPPPCCLYVCAYPVAPRFFFERTSWPCPQGLNNLCLFSHQGGFLKSEPTEIPCFMEPSPRVTRDSENTSVSSYVGISIMSHPHFHLSVYFR